MASQPTRIAVIGAGIVGVCTAIELRARGFDVLLLDPEPAGGPQAASYGNGAFISPASILPMSFPGIWRRLPGYLMDAEGPLVIRWRSVLPNLPWFWGFLRAGSTWPRLSRIAGHLNALLADAPARHQALACAAGAGHLIRRTGLIYAFPDRAAYQAEVRFWDLRRRHGVALEELDTETLRARVPALSPAYRFGIQVTGGAHCTDPGGFTAALARWAEAQGVQVISARATGFQAADGRLSAVHTALGPIRCAAAVVAAGYGARGLARLAGDRIPMLAERGYHVEVASPRVAPEIPVMPQDGKMANTLTAGGLRASGQVELAADGTPPDWGRANLLLQQLLRTYPGLGPVDSDAVRRWQGNRPSTPDALPVISASLALPGLYYACGHGHSGFAAAPHTAAMVADLVEGKGNRLAETAFSLARFMRRRGRAR
ncbi:NAD(P)/FAD-dependent oxidoreductase [Chachezhania sediminis]|uniref:NAD(P)/FAD-dependent oxidoreductase n=1 Tax=Chachezhania sediminis TaxID=2599291 RepID=UPI00131C95C1|nr:FAD-dependent oxidoreductase [Chachezhania sediminis]